MTRPAADVPAWEDPRKVLARHGLRPNRRFSQNFLVSRSVVTRIAEATEARPGDRVVELGPGLGTLTTELLRTGAHVIAVEQDRAMIRVLEAELSTVATFCVEHGDAAKVSLEGLADRGPVTVAGNLPYAVTGGILRNLVEQATWVRRAVLMVQREVRDRLRAEPGTKDYGALTVFVSRVFSVDPVLTVRPGSFHPPPKVASAVVRLVPHPSPRAEETAAFQSVVRAAFEARRKTLRNALLGRVAEAAAVDRALDAAGIEGRRRGETLSVEEFGALAEAVAAG